MVRAIFPGTFDPIHFGHIDIATRATKIFDELIVAVYDRPLKNLLFTPQERIELTRESFQDNPRIKVVGYNSLTVNFCHEMSANVIVRGLRVFSDFEREGELMAKAEVIARYAPTESVCIGDGPTDLNMARASDLVFARDGLARFLDHIKKPYLAWNDFFDVRAALRERWK